jgi:NAD(P)-dependent dehydrogenase (short-subunit alcohol dehydrogenase family)
VTDEQQVKNTAKTILDTWPDIDVLVNNAGSYSPSSFYETSATEFKYQIDINLTSAFLITQAFLLSMVQQKKGDIFFVCSIASLHGYSGSVAYCAAKHGLLGLARTLRCETKSKGIRVVSLMPGETLTPAWGNTDISEDQFIPAADIANTIVDMYRLDRRTNIDEIVIRPQLGSFSA